MSIWTHVNSSIRFDHMHGLQDKFDFGRIINYDTEGNWDTIVPCGSEGSLEISIWENPDKSCMAAYTVNIFGDLRDYENDKEIINYFNSIVKGKMIRSGFFSIECNRERFFNFDFDDEIFKEIK